MESSASALHKVSAEAREAKETRNHTEKNGDLTNSSEKDYDFDTSLTGVLPSLSATYELLINSFQHFQ